MTLGMTGIPIAFTFLTTAVATASDTTEKAKNLPARTPTFAIGASAKLSGTTLLLATHTPAVTERRAGAQQFPEPLDELGDLLTTSLLQFFTGFRRGDIRWCGCVGYSEWLRVRIQVIDRVRLRDGSGQTGE